MANVLGELFGNIAGAIREKTGDSATMKPIEFPDKIRGITGGGGNGESSEGVVYSGVSPLIPVATYFGYHFVLSGELYYLRQTASINSSDKLPRLYKLVDGEYSLVHDSCTGLGAYLSWYFFLECNGRVHAIERDNKHYIMADDYTWQRLTDFPFYQDADKAGLSCVHNGELYLANNKYLYKWNEDTDTTEAVAAVDGASSPLALFVRNGNLHILYRDSTYTAFEIYAIRDSNAELTHSFVLPSTNERMSKVVKKAENAIWYTSNYDRAHLFKLDIERGIVEACGNGLLNLDAVSPEYYEFNGNTYVDCGISGSVWLHALIQGLE